MSRGLARPHEAMVNVECPGCSAPYSVSDRRIPDRGLKMRCPKCGTSFLVEKPAGAGAEPKRPPPPRRATAVGNFPSTVKPGRAAQSVGALTPPPTKKPLFAPSGDEGLEVELDGDLSVDELMGSAERAHNRTMLGGSGSADLDDEGGFGVLDMGFADAGRGATAPHGGFANLPTPTETDLPMSASHDDLPVPVDGDLPMAAVVMPQRAPRPTDLGWTLDDELPVAAEADLPMAAHDDLPMRADADLPMPAEADLPMAADGYLPVPVEADLPLPLHGDLPMASRHGDLPLPADGDYPVRARHGDLPLPADQDFPSAHAFGDLPFAGDHDLPIPSADGDLPHPGDFNLPQIGTSGDDAIPLDGDEPPRDGVRAFGHGRAGRHSDGDSIELDGDRGAGDQRTRDEAPLDRGNFPGEGPAFEADLDSVPPRAMAPAAPPAPPRKQEPVGHELEVEQEDPASVPGPTSFDAPLGDAPRAKIKKKRLGAMRVLIVAVPFLAIAGGLLSFTPLGPYGYFAITDGLNEDTYAQNLSNLRGLAQDELAVDTSAAAESLYQRARAEQEAMPRYHPMRAYAAYIAFMTSLRFGNDPEAMATGRQLLDSIDPEERTPLVELAKGAGAAAEGDLNAARASAQAALAGLPGDIDAAVLVAEIALRLRSKDAVDQWKKAVAIRKDARTLYGLARAQAEAGETAAAIATAQQVLEISKDHAGARLLLAEARFEKDPKADDVLAELDWVSKAGPVRSAASRGELVLAYSLLGDVHLARSKLTAAEKAYAEALKLDPQSVRALVGNGELFFVAGRFSEALARFEAASRVAPDNVHALVGKAKTKIALERPKEARTELEAAIKTSKHPLVGYWLGKAREAMGDFKLAEESYRQAIQSAPGHADVVYPYVQLADLLSARGAQDQAAEILREASDKLPNNPRLHLAKGEAALKTGHVEDAKRELLRALDLDADNSVARFRLAVALRRNREFDAARATLDQVAKADPEYPGITLERGLIYEGTGEIAKAIEMYKSALEKAPDDVDLKLRVGSTLVVSGAPEQAVPLLREVLTKRGQSAEVNHFLGRALLVLGEPPAEALRYLQSAVRYDPNRAEYHLYEAWAANEAGQPAIAEAAIEKALALDKNLGDAYWQRAILLQKRGQTLDALEELEMALERNPSRFEAYATMARCYQDQADYARAEGAWKKAIAGNDKMPEWHFRLGKILVDRGARAEAAEHLRKSVDIVEQRRQTPGWLWNAQFLLGEALRDSDQERALRAYKEFIRLTTSENAYRRDAERAIEALESR